jgi:predicted permease
MTLALPLLFLLLGVGLRYINLLPEKTPHWLNSFVIYISLPAITLLYIHRIPLEVNIIIPAAVAWGVFLISIPVFIIAAHTFQWSKTTTGALILSCGFGNTSFVGFPVVEALYGQEALKIAVLVDQPGSFLMLSTLGLATAAYFAGEQLRPGAVFKRMLLFPAFPVFVISLALAVMQIKLPEELNELLNILGKTITPLALTSIGMQLSLDRKEIQPGKLLTGLGYKLIIAPVVIALAFSLSDIADDLTTKVCIMEAAMGPMVSAAIVAIQYDLQPRLVSQVVGIGIPVSFATLALWYLLVG